jgi:hypothetical protein
MNKKTIFILFFLLVSVYYNNSRQRRIDWDVFGYYLYLPAHFIHHDITLEEKDKWLTPLIAKYSATDNLYQAYKGPKNKYVMKYTMGLSFVYAPFFFIADFLAPKLGYERDGLSPPYQFLMLICAILFSLIGIYYLFKILSLYFDPTVVLTTVAFFVFGTNYFVMTAFDGLMPHNFIFTFFGIMLYTTIKWYEEQKLKYAIIIGVCLGISVLIRPTSIVVGIIPLLWNVENFSALKNRVSLLIKKFPDLLFLGLAAFIIILPQLAYWKSVSGEWFFYSYPGEKIDLSDPHLKDVLFSYKKGWLLYTPLIVFAIIGFGALYKKYRALFVPIFLFFLINTYIISCWDCWWYGGSFAQRPFVESYVFMVFPFAALVTSISLKKLSLLIPALAIGLFCIYLNLFQTRQALNGVLHTSLTTKEYYWRVFLKREATEEDKRWLEPSQYGSEKDALNGTVQYNTIYGANLLLDEYTANLNANNVFSKSILIPTNLGYDANDKYLVPAITIDTNKTNSSADLVAHLVVCINKSGKLYAYRSHDFSFNDLKNNGGNGEMSVLVPPQVNEKNFELKSYVYIDGNGKLKLTSFNVRVLSK